MGDSVTRMMVINVTKSESLSRKFLLNIIGYILITFVINANFFDMSVNVYTDFVSKSYNLIN